MAYIGKSPTGAGVRSRFHFTATGGETSLSGADDNGKTLVFADGEYVDVYLNGVLLFDGDYNTTTANTVGGLAALTASDVVEIVVYDIFSVADTVSAKNGGTFSSDVTVNGDLTVDTDTLYVDSANDRIGVRTTSPSKAFVISNDGAAGLEIDPFNRSAGTGTSLLSYNRSSNAYVRADYDASEHLMMVSGSEKMRIDSSGDVGIGTSSPSARLEVNEDTFQIMKVRRGTSGTNAGIITFEQGDGTAVGHVGGAGGGGLQFRTGAGSGTERARINSSGTFMVAKTDASLSTVGSYMQNDGFIGACRDDNPPLGLNRLTGDGGMILFQRNGSTVGSVSSTTSSTSYNTSSDHRLKENVEDMTGAITRVKSLKPKRFSWIIDDEDSANIDGFLAHEAQSVVPEAVTGTHNEVDADGDAVYQGIDQSKLVPLLTGALQEAITKIETLETEMTALKARVTALENA